MNIVSRAKKTPPDVDPSGGVFFNSSSKWLAQWQPFFNPG